MSTATKIQIAVVRMDMAIVAAGHALKLAAPFILCGVALLLVLRWRRREVKRNGTRIT